MICHYKDRTEAGQYLASLLTAYKNKPNTIVLAIPRGGVPVAFEIANHLNLPLEIFLVRKIGMPYDEEFAIGAIADNNVCILDKTIIEHFKIKDEQIEGVIYREKNELKRRQLRYRQGKPPPNLKDKHIILVDDGIATGSTVKAVTQALQLLAVKDITLAIPVASADSIKYLTSSVEKIICPIKQEPFYSVGQWYQNFDQISDDTVIYLLQKSNNNAKN